MNLTKTDELRSYWHIQIHHDGTNWILHRRKEEEWPDITAMMVSDSGAYRLVVYQDLPGFSTPRPEAADVSRNLHDVDLKPWPRARPSSQSA